MLPLLRGTGDNTNITLNSNISKTVLVNVAFTITFVRRYSISYDIQVDFQFMVLYLLMLKVYEIIRISKIKFFNFTETERVQHILKSALFVSFTCYLLQNVSAFVIFCFSCYCFMMKLCLGNSL